MTTPSSNVPGYGTARRANEARETDAYSGMRSTGDPTNEPGQYPPGDGYASAIFGGPLPVGTGAPGTAGAQLTGGTDATNEPGQVDDGLTGLSERDITETGAPGTAGARPSAGTGPDSVTITRPGSYLSGSYASDVVRDSVDGTQDWTGANDSGYGTDGPKLPGMAEPTANGGPFQPSSGGRVLRGGRAVNP